MSVDIAAMNGAALNVTNAAWRFVLEFSRRQGWNPLGTSKPDWFGDAEPWDGGYDPAMGQDISPEDAAAFGEALDRGLRNPNLQDVLAQVQRDMNARMKKVGYEESARGEVTEKTILMLRKLAELARGSGGFRIE